MNHVCIVLFHFGLVTESQHPLCVGLARFQFLSSRDPLHCLRHCFQADDAQSKECQVKYLLKLLLSVTQVKRLGLYVFKVANKKMSQFSFKFRHIFAGLSLPNLSAGILFICNFVSSTRKERRPSKCNAIPNCMHLSMVKLQGMLRIHPAFFMQYTSI